MVSENISDTTNRKPLDTFNKQTKTQLTAFFLKESIKQKSPAHLSPKYLVKNFYFTSKQLRLH